MLGRMLQASLKTACMREFELLGVGEEAPSPQLLARLHDCCLVVDALGFKVGASHCLPISALAVDACLLQYRPG